MTITVKGWEIILRDASIANQCIDKKKTQQNLELGRRLERTIPKRVE